ncbi:hypothetical protein NS115_10270 [Paenibacillus jamilae]|uniref:Uncharacterized protein n=1 Tax=Paenibacillus jamilae TaxID=114136 RepID=A0ACC4ZVV2_9BACL|nr:hypothetical protein C0638_09710 [Paenibacillus sp. lzh-N1]KTS82826.1 hypothetical protein NS115_10270 [Paenibacillus jamilae]
MVNEKNKRLELAQCQNQYLVIKHSDVGLVWVYEFVGPQHATEGFYDTKCNHLSALNLSAKRFEAPANAGSLLFVQ